VAGQAVVAPAPQHVLEVGDPVRFAKGGGGVRGQAHAHADGPARVVERVVPRGAVEVVGAGAAVDAVVAVAAADAVVAGASDDHGIAGATDGRVEAPGARDRGRVAHLAHVEHVAPLGAADRDRAHGGVGTGGVVRPGGLAGGRHGEARGRVVHEDRAR